MMPEEIRFEKAISYITPKASKWSREVINSINQLDLDDEGKDAILLWILELLLFHTPYPNKIITHTLATITSHVSVGEALGYLDWSKRDRIFEKINIREK